MPQTVFNIETSGGVLIVVPRGDAVGFRDAEVHAGVQSVLEQIRSAARPLVVVDLGNAGYFGSVIIGALVTFANATDGAGGVFAVCNASADMGRVLKVMNLAERWMMCDTRQDAILAVQGATS